MSTSRAACALALLAVTIGMRAPILRIRTPIDDESTYAVVAETILDGGRPYADAVERKPPLLFYVYAAVLKVVGRFNWRGLHAAEVAWVAGTMAGLYLAGVALFDASTGAMAALLYSVFALWGGWNSAAFNGELLMNLPIAWAYAAVFSRRRLLRRAHVTAAGALLAAAFLLKQPAAIAAVPLGVYLLLPSYGWNRGFSRGEQLVQASCLSASFAAVLGTVAVWLYARGLLADAFYWTIRDHDIPIVFWHRGLEHTLGFAVLCLPLTCGAWVSARNATWWSRRRPERTALLLFAAVSLVGAAASGRFYPHYYIALVPPLALLAAPALVRLLRAPAHTAWPLAPSAAVWIVAAAVFFVAADARGLATVAPTTDAGAFLRTHARPTARIFVWGQASRIYLDARLRPASRYIATFPLTGLIFGDPPGHIDTTARILPGAWENLQKDFAAHPPDYIVDTEVGATARYRLEKFPELKRLLEARYRCVFTSGSAVVYQRAG